MPVIIEWIYSDGSSEIDRIPAQIWRRNEYEIKKTFIKSKEVVKVNLDPNFEIPDTEINNNTFPKIDSKSDFDKFKEQKSK